MVTSSLDLFALLAFTSPTRANSDSEDEDEHTAHSFQKPAHSALQDCIHPRKDEPGYEAETQLYINPVECIDCGACVPVCPVTAIFALDDLPEKWQNFTPINADWYTKKA